MIEKTKQWNFMKTIPNLVSTLRYVAHGILAGLLLVIEISSNICISHSPQKENIPGFPIKFFD